MKTIYITEQGATLRRDGPVLQVWTARKKKSELLVHDLDQLVIMGNIIVTPAVLDFLIAERIDTVFLSIHGRFRGRLMHEHSKNVSLRLAQYRQLQQQDVCLALAKAIVRGKIRNTRTFLLKVSRRHGRTQEVEQVALRLAVMGDRVMEMTTLDQVRGCEGRASALYFGIFGTLLRNDHVSFHGRNRRPPLDPVNVLLSLGYTLLANSVETAVQVVGLDPYLGALHDVVYGRPSLVCDLVEEYRAMIVDPMVVACINQKAFKRDDFEEQSEGEPVRMEKSAVRWFVDIFERRLRCKIVYPPRGQRLLFRQVIEEQVRHMARVLMGTDPEYFPFQVR
jgi:CRISPR-associated protein Cas1